LLFSFDPSIFIELEKYPKGPKHIIHSLRYRKTISFFFISHSLWLGPETTGVKTQCDHPSHFGPMRDFRLQWSLAHGLYVNHGPLPKGKLGKRAKYKKLGFLP